MDHKKWWMGLSIAVVVVFFSSFAGSLFQLQYLTQETGYIKEQLDDLKIQVSDISEKFTVFITTEARFHADKKETFDLINILLKERNNGEHRRVN